MLETFFRSQARLRSEAVQPAASEAVGASNAAAKLCLYVHTCTWGNIPTYIHICTYISVYIYISTYISTYIYIYIYTYI